MNPDGDDESLFEPLDFEADEAVHQQMARRVRQAIARGRLVAGDQLPSVRAFAKAMLINPNTVVRVYRELEQAGYLVTQQGKGVFVARGAPRLSLRSSKEAVSERLRDAVEQARATDMSASDLEALWKKAKKGME